MTSVITSYILVAGEGFGLSESIGIPAGIAVAFITLGVFMTKIRTIDKIEIKKAS